MANNGKDKTKNGAFKDVRKSKLFFFSEDKLSSKTELADLRKTVFMDRYSLRGDDGDTKENYPEQMWARVAKGIAQFEKNKAFQDKWEKKFYKVMKDFKFVPAGRILSGAGTGYEVTFFNCYVIPSPSDSRGGIMENITQTVEIQSRAGGVGVNLSTLRPRGARVRKVNGTSSGPVNWAALYSTANHDVIQQGGSRRGALMLMLNDWHPDVEEFIRVKEDLTKIPGANLSVCVTDKFMDAVKADKNWDLIFPDYAETPDYDEFWDGDIDKWIESGRKVKVYKTVKAREVWDMVAKAAWTSAEPGLHFIERSNKRSNTYYFEKLIATNPSLRKGTRVLTKQGIVPIEELEGKEFMTKNLNGQWSMAKCFLSGKNKRLYRITLNNGKKIYTTAEHKWPVALNGGGFGKVQTKDLRAGNILPFPEVSDIEFELKKKLSREQGFMVGWLYGDGWISDRKTETEPSYHIETDEQGLGRLVATSHGLSMNKRVFGFLFSEEEKYLAQSVLKEVNKLKKVSSNLKQAGDNTYTIQATSVEFAENLYKKFGVTKKENGLPISIWSSGSEYLKGFIDGLFSSDGFVAKNARRVVYTTKNKKIADDISDLLSFYGIKSVIRRAEAQDVKFPNGKRYYKTYVRYDVYIDGSNAINFSKIFSLSHKRKQTNLNSLAKFAPTRKYPDEGLIRVTSIKKTKLKEDVWDVSVYDDTHCFYINSVVTGNCGEQPLGAWAVCNLGAMNLTAYVDSRGEFDYDSLEKDVAVAMRFMDNVVDANFYFYPETYESQMDIRRTGLGTMGLGDALIMMKVPYGTDESVNVIDKIYKTIRDSAYRTSSLLAAEKGSFRKFDREKYLEGWFIKRLPLDIRESIAKNGIRNAVLLTQAPTGTTSLLSGVSSGIEPVYNFEFKRKDRTGEHVIYHPLFEEWKNEHPNEPKPDYFVCAMDLSPEEHLKVQAKVQEYTDSSISKTVNAPNDYTVEDVRDLYTKAYDWGCKGITFFRDGSRAGVLENVEKPKEIAADAPAKEEAPERTPEPVFADAAQLSLPVSPEAGKTLVARPFVVQGATYKLKTPVGTAFITINHDEAGEPLEVFINIGKAGSDVSAFAVALGRTISAALRFRSTLTPKERAFEIAEQLKDIGGRRSVGFGQSRIRSLPDAISVALSAHFGFKMNGNGAYANGHSNGKVILTENETSVIEAGAIEVDSPGGQMMMAAVTQSEPQYGAKVDLCPECGEHSLVFEEGCAKCYSCGHAEC